MLLAISHIGPMSVRGLWTPLWVTHPRPVGFRLLVEYVVWKDGLVRNLPDRDQQRGVCQPVDYATDDG
jgi:hypothetical protein